MHETIIEICKDGSDTLFSNRFGEHYHNHNGAVTESRYVFIEKTKVAAHLAHNPETHVLEIGFGTGLNFALILDLILQLKDSGKLIYHSVEAFPIDDETAGKLNYSRFLEHPGVTEWLPGIFQNLKRGENIFTPSDHLELHIFYELFDDFIIPNSFADIIFFDAFSPNTNPDLWTGEVFKKLKKGSNPDVIMSTYCAASSARAAMAWAGWFVARVPGTLGKREMTLASLNPDLLRPYKRINEKRLAWRYERGEFGESQST